MYVNTCNQCIHACVNYLLEYPSLVNACFMIHTFDVLYYVSLIVVFGNLGKRMNVSQITDRCVIVL